METIVETRNLRVEFRTQNSGQAGKWPSKTWTCVSAPGRSLGFSAQRRREDHDHECAARFRQCDQRAAFLFGVDVREPIARQRIGYLPELTYYYKFLTAEELLRFYARIFGIPRGEADRRIEQLLKLVELESAASGRSRPIPRACSSGWGWPRP